MPVNQRRITFYCERNVREAFSETMKCCEANRFIRTRSSVASVKTQSDEAVRTISEVVTQLSLLCRCIFYQSQSSSRDEDEDRLFLFFPVTRAYSYCLFYFLLLPSNSFSLMNCGQRQLNQEGKELFNSFVFWVVAFMIGVCLGDHQVGARAGTTGTTDSRAFSWQTLSFSLE